MPFEQRAQLTEAIEDGVASHSCHHTFIPLPQATWEIESVSTELMIHAYF
jgi:hypothetical protein